MHERTSDLELARVHQQEAGGWLLDQGDGEYLVTDDPELVRDLRGSWFIDLCEKLGGRDETREPLLSDPIRTGQARFCIANAKTGQTLVFTDVEFLRADEDDILAELACNVAPADPPDMRKFQIYVMPFKEGMTDAEYYGAGGPDVAGLLKSGAVLVREVTVPQDRDCYQPYGKRDDCAFPNA